MSTSVAKEDFEQNSTQFAHELKFLKSAGEVPSLPNTAYQLLLMSLNDRVNARDVIGLIKSDPNLAARIIRYSKSAYFGYRGEMESVEQAVVSVLGLSLTVNIAIGISLCNQFNKSNAGPLGLHEFWRHSINHALLMQGLSARVPNHHHVKMELAYLCGLLHDFGILVIGQVNRRQSILVNEMITANPDSSRIELETQILGYSHNNIGACLLHSWQLPPAVIAVAANHHNYNYKGDFQSYVRLATLGDYVLKHYVIVKQPKTNHELPLEIQRILCELNLTDQDIIDLSTRLEVMEKDLNALADLLIG